MCRTSWPRWVSPMCWVWVAVAPSPPSCLVPGISASLLMTLCGITCCPGSHRLCVSLVRPHSHITAIEQDFLRFLMHMITKHLPCCHHCVWTMLYFCDSARSLHSRLYAVGWVSSGNTIEAAGYAKYLDQTGHSFRNLMHKSRRSFLDLFSIFKYLLLNFCFQKCNLQCG